MIILDAAQAIAHHYEILEKTGSGCDLFSAHKMYAPSLGVIVARRDLVPKLRLTFVGGEWWMMCFEDRYMLSAEGNKDHVHTIF